MFVALTNKNILSGSSYQMIPTCRCDVNLCTHLSAAQTLSTDWEWRPLYRHGDHECFQLPFHSKNPIYIRKRSLLSLSGASKITSWKSASCAWLESNVSALSQVWSRIYDDDDDDEGDGKSFEGDGKSRLLQPQRCTPDLLSDDHKNNRKCDWFNRNWPLNCI